MRYLLLLTLLLPLPALADANDAATRARMVLMAKERDYFVQEGVGLKAVHIGQSFQHVLKTWGKPATTRSGLPLVGEDAWYYRADRFTEVRLRGKDTVQAMAFRGQVGSPYQTGAGATFGMKLTDVRNAYRGPGVLSSDGKVLDFPGSGIRFQMVNGAVDGFEVYAPVK